MKPARRLTANRSLNLGERFGQFDKRDGEGAPRISSGCEVGCPAPANFTCSLPKNFLSKGAQMARRPQPPWWWRTEVLALVATALSAAVTTTYLVRLLTPYL